MALLKAFRGRRDRMTLEIKAEFDPDELKDEIRGIQKRAKSFIPIFLRIKEDLRQHWAGNFASNGLPVGGWDPLDPEYAAWKSAHFPGPTMVRTGRLFRSLTRLEGNASDLGGREATFGTKIEYAKFHQYGTLKMPKRLLIYEPAGASQKWAEWAADYLAGSFADRRQRWGL
tara:strand:- start:35 stop:550 length:516 start_codon:yes stop_codon:yes gene_type:complete